jgi:hypothetical protein
MTHTASGIQVSTAIPPHAWPKRNWLLLAVLACIIAVRLVSAFHVYDVFRDEESIHGDVLSIMATGRDTHGKLFPLYTQVGHGNAFVTYTYLYPMAVLCRVFGQSVTAARLVLQALTILGCFLLADAVRRWGAGARCWRAVLVVSLTLPWGFVQANRLWDPALVPIYFAVAFWFVTNVLRAGPGGARSWHVAGAAVSLVLLAIIYPPNRIPAALLWLWVFTAGWREGRVSVRQLALAAACSVVASLPLLYSFRFHPGFNTRPLELFVFNNRPFGLALLRLGQSFSSLFNADFLFVTGDAIPRHSLHFLFGAGGRLPSELVSGDHVPLYSLPIFGMLGPLSVVPLWTLLRRCRFERPLSLMAGLIVLTCLSVGCTYEYTPHGLRSCLVWMPWAVLLGCGWDVFLEGKKPWTRGFWYAAYAVWFAVYFVFYMIYNR